MLVFALFLYLAAPPPGYANVPNHSVKKCDPIDEKMGRLLEKWRDDHEKRPIYFDLNRWPCEDDALRDANWYSAALTTLKEPSFAVRFSAKGYQDRFRLLAFSHVGAGYILRLDFRKDGTAVLTFAESDWVKAKGSTEERPLPPKRVFKRSWSKPVDDALAQALRERLIGSGILRSRLLPLAPFVSSDSDDGSEQTICIPWATAILERLDANGVQTLAATGCEQEGVMDELIDALHELAGYQTLTLKPLDEVNE